MAFNLNHEGQRTQGRWVLTINSVPEMLSYLRIYIPPPKKILITTLNCSFPKNPVTVGVILSGHKSFKAGFFHFMIKVKVFTLSPITDRLM